MDSPSAYLSLQIRWCWDACALLFQKAWWRRGYAAAKSDLVGSVEPSCTCLKAAGGTEPEADPFVEATMKAVDQQIEEAALQMREAEKMIGELAVQIKEVEREMGEVLKKMAGDLGEVTKKLIIRDLLQLKVKHAHLGAKKNGLTARKKYFWAHQNFLKAIAQMKSLKATKGYVSIDCQGDVYIRVRILEAEA